MRTQLSPQKRGTAPTPVIGPCLLWSNVRPPQLLLTTCRNSRPRTTCPNFIKVCVRISHTMQRYRHTGQDRTGQTGQRLDSIGRTVCNVGVLWPNGWMDKDETWHGGRPRPWPHCVGWDPGAPPQGGTGPQCLVLVYCGQTVSHVSYC